MYLGYGILGGLGMGMGYITPVATLVKWFPDMRGLMTGVAVCGYGFGALILLAWGLGAIPSPIMIARIHQTQGTYAPAIHAVAILMLFYLALPLIARPPRKREAPRAQTRAAA